MDKLVNPYLKIRRTSAESKSSVFSKEELYEAIKSKQIASHPAWEDYIVWKNKEKYIDELKERLFKEN
ncbi:MAG: hypothetical protein WBC40_04465 [Halobacteriota archaeon]